MTQDCFMKIGDIKGESLDDSCTDQIEVLEWSWDISQPGSMATGGGGGMGRADFSALNFSHRVDKATPNLMKICATGDHVDEATMTVRKSGKDPQPFLIIKMKKVFVTQVSPCGQGGDGDLSEHVSLQFCEVDLEYCPQKEDGSLDAGIKFGYDIKANKLL